MPWKINLCLCPKPLWTPQEAVHQRNYDDFWPCFDWILWTAFCFSDEKPAWLPQVWLKLFLLKCNWNLSRVWVWVWVAPNPLPGSFHRFKIDRSKIVHVDSQIKDSSNSFRRRYSSEDVDAKFGSTLPKDFAVKWTRTNMSLSSII